MLEQNSGATYANLTLKKKEIEIRKTCKVSIAALHEEDVADQPKGAPILRRTAHVRHKTWRKRAACSVVQPSEKVQRFGIIKQLNEPDAIVPPGGRGGGRKENARPRKTEAS